MSHLYTFFFFFFFYAPKKQIETICEEKLTYAVTKSKGGGCAGFEYEWGTYKSPEELLDDDEIIKTDNGYTFVIGSASMMFPFRNCNRLQKRHNRANV